MEQVRADKLKMGLSRIKRGIQNSSITRVWNLRKADVIKAIKRLNYKYDQPKNELRTDSMIRKPRRIKL